MATFSYEQFVKNAGGGVPTVVGNESSPDFKKTAISGGGIMGALKGETSFPASEGGITSGAISTNIAKTFGNIPSSAAKLAAPINPLNTESPANIGANIAGSGSALKDIYSNQSPAEGTKNILKGFADTYLKIGETIYGGLDKAYNALLDDPKKAMADVTAHIAKIGIEDPMLIPTLLYGGGELKGGKDTISRLASPVTRGADTSAANIASEVSNVASKTGQQIVDTTKRATSKIIKTAEPKPPTPTQAVGQVLQGETGDIKSGVRGLSTLDTENVKTYSDLKGKIDTKITELTGKVDTDLGVDTTKIPLKDLTITNKTKSGKPVVTTPVNDALTQLKELYTSTSDKVSAANIDELIQKAETEGLTRLEVNNIARVYGQEFKNKAFSKMGDPLTSVNAQMYENTRTALKTLAREGIKGAEAKTADKLMSSLYDMKTLVEKNVEAVNKLQQKILERGLLEKVGHAVSKYADVLTGGSLRGFVGGLLPRGAGYKVLNALDIENALNKNLKIIQEAIASKSDNEVVKILEGLKPKAK